jgi:hypothetical protein
MFVPPKSALYDPAGLGCCLLICFCGCEDQIHCLPHARQGSPTLPKIFGLLWRWIQNMTDSFKERQKLQAISGGIWDCIVFTSLFDLTSLFVIKQIWFEANIELKICDSISKNLLSMFILDNYHMGILLEM